MTAFERCVIENHAQLIRFVQRSQMTSKEAALLSEEHAEALFETMGWAKPKPNLGPLTIKANDAD